VNQTKISYLVISDIHLGHSRTKTKYIVNNLLTYFSTNHKIFKNLDILFLAGDVYDKLLATNSEDFILANEWLATLAIYCKTNNIKLRILEGTPSHDWHQVGVFNTNIESFASELDYKYIDTLSIEFIDDLGITVLYVPDEWNENASDTETEVQALLDKYSLEQLPSSHNEDFYLSKVKHFINIGHIHIGSANGRILAQGSFDRLSHNEEGDKGGLVMTLYHTGDREYKFIKNKNAHPFKSFDLSDKDAPDMLAILDKKLPKLDPITNVRIIIPNDSYIYSSVKDIVDRYGLVNLKIDRKKPKLVAAKIQPGKVIEAFSITSDNIEELLHEELVKYKLSDADRSIAYAEIKDAMNSV